MKILKTLWKKWLRLAQAIGNFQSRVLLTIFYFTLLLPFLIMVSFFSDRMNKKRPQKSGWTDWVERYQTLDEARGQY